QPIWQQSFHSIQSLLLLENCLLVLDGDGTLYWLDPANGNSYNRSRMEPGQLFSFGHCIGLLTRDGDLQVLDMNGQSLWRYQSGQNPACLPLVTDRALLLPLMNGSIVALNLHYYGASPNDLQIQTNMLERLETEKQWDSLKLMTDSLLRQEPGNATAWMHKARYFSERATYPDSILIAWSNAARHARHLASAQQQKILVPYARQLGADWIQYLPPSTQQYPQLFGSLHNLFTIDAGNRNLVALDPNNGQFRWRAPTPPLEQGFVEAEDKNILAIASGYDLAILDLMQKGRQVASINLPGKAFQILVSRTAIFVSTWNGFVLRIQRKNFESAWSRKMFNSGAILALSEDLLYTLSLDGELGILAVDGGIQHGETRPIGYSPSQMILADSILVLGSQDGRLQFLNIHNLEPIWEHNMDSQIFSMQAVLGTNPDSSGILLGLGDQSLVFVSLATHEKRWSYAGSGSIYIQPKVQQNTVWIDQEHALVSLDLANGAVLRKIHMPDAVGPIWTSPLSVITSSPQGLLFSFPL
ncbi:MAG TPA: PQQ-binding-like beta-propeller repeat protein, partial [Fibrobacteraceae bacterium]|nr:PQQ-binding-like beta-propeller repeat protein [Fibrobacteraceae bacterium]